MEPRPGVTDPLGDPKDGHILTRAIIDTIHEPLVVLDEDLRIVVASLSFYKKFDLTQAGTSEQFFYDIADRQWDIPVLRTLLDRVISEHVAVKGYEVEHTFPFFGPRTMLINAREIRYENGRKKMLLSIFDITDQRALEKERERLVAQKDLLLKEMRHRIANSLQLIASILMLKAATVNSDESRADLEDAHERIMSIATAQQQLEPVGRGENIPVSGYLAALCKSLARSMVGGRRPITVEVKAGPGAVPSDTAVSFGLITTELVINALKHAFPEDTAGKVTVSYKATDTDWVLSVADDGIGLASPGTTQREGLGTSIIDALANQLGAVIRTESSSAGTKISIVYVNQE